MRRVVTGHAPDRKSIFVSDEELEPVEIAISPGTQFNMLWGGDEAPTYPDGGSLPDTQMYFPPVGGFRFVHLTMPPQFLVQPDELDLDAGLRDMEKKMPGAAQYMETDGGGMHTTDTIDFEYIISGEIWLELDDGKEVHLQAGDTVIQNGTRHAWRNKSTQPCHMIIFLVGAKRTQQKITI